MKKIKFDKSIQISEKDKKILWVVGAFLILFLSYYFGTCKIIDQTESYEAQLTSAKSKQRDLAEKTANKEQYEEDTAKYQSKYNTILSSYDNGSSQDSILVFLSNLETITGGWIKSTTFATPSSIYAFGQTASTNPGSSGGKSYSTDMVGYKTTLTLAYEADYEDLKSVISYINNYYSKNTIDSVSMSYNDVTGVVSGTMTVSTYCITGSTRLFETPSIDVETGTDNLFKSLTFSSVSNKTQDETGNYILSNYDYYLLVNPSGSDHDSCMIGRKDDDTGSSLLSTNYNEQQKVSIVFSGSDGNYTVRYKIGDVTYPAVNYDTGETFDPKDSLDLLIMSSSRLSSSDKSSVVISLENDTDMNLHVKVCNDDADDPRVEFSDKKGDISIYQ